MPDPTIPTISCDTCGHIACVCSVIEAHDEQCRYRRAVTCPVGIECQHGYDVCPECDPCTCGVEPLSAWMNEQRKG